MFPQFFVIVTIVSFCIRNNKIFKQKLYVQVKCRLTTVNGASLSTPTMKRSNNNSNNRIWMLGQFLGGIEALRTTILFNSRFRHDARLERMCELKKREDIESFKSHVMPRMEVSKYLESWLGLR